MKRTARQTYIPQPQPPVLDAAQLDALADRAIVGDVVQSGSLMEFCALLAVLQARGYELKRRTEWEQRAAPWLFLVVPAETPGGARGQENE